MGCSIVQTIAPTQEPVSIDELKTRLRITHNDEDLQLQRYLKAATEFCQEYQWAQFCTATYEERYDRWPAELRPRRSPLIAVTSLKYVDTGGTTQTLVANTDYTVDQYAKPARIIPAYLKTWPATRGHINDVVLTYTAGYGDPDDVPDEIKQAILLKAAQQWDECASGNKAIEMVIQGMLDKRSFRTFY